MVALSSLPQDHRGHVIVSICLNHHRDRVWVTEDPEGWTQPLAHLWRRPDGLYSFHGVRPDVAHFSLLTGSEEELQSLIIPAVGGSLPLMPV